MAETFTKEERLSKKSLISKLFEEGKKIYSFPFRVTILQGPIPTSFPAQVLISVPRNLFKRATDRNRIKRLIREAYRKNKFILYETLEARHKQMLICVQYTPKEILSYQMIQEKIIVLLQRLKEVNDEDTG